MKPKYHILSIILVISALMKPKYHILSIILVISALFTPRFALGQSTMGTDFWLTFMDNIDTTMHSQALSIFATSNNPCTATVSNPNTGWSQTFLVDPSTSNRIYIPLNQAYTTSSNAVTNTGLHVTSTDTISLYSITQGYPNLDYANILPTVVLGSNYIVQTFPSDRYSAEFAIVAAEDDVTVSITLSGDIIGSYHAGQTYTMTLLHAGQVLQVRSMQPGDLSGTRITALNNKKIAVFNGDACVYIPSYSVGPSCDHVVEQATPIECWGKNFIVPASRLSLKDYVRITAKNDNCTVSVNGSVVATLATSQTYQYRMSSTQTSDYIQTSQPAVVYQYFSSFNGAGAGDPAMTTITPLEQCYSSISFPVIATSNISSHWINVICHNDAVPSIYLDGVSVAAYFTPVAANPQYSYLRRTLNQGTHTLVDNSSTGFVAFLFGSGNRVSYGYPLGFAGQLLQKVFELFVNENNARFFLHGYDVCIRDTVLFNVGSSFNQFDVDWDFGDGVTASSNPASHVFTTEGDDRFVCAYISYTDTNEQGLAVLRHDTLCTTLHVRPDFHRVYYDTCVENALPKTFGGRSYYGDVVNDTFANQTVYGCDSINVYNLKVWYNDTLTYDTVVCDTLLPFLWRNVTFMTDSVAMVKKYNVHGADSVAILRFHTMTCRPIPIEPETPIDSVAIWAPNVFTPTLQDANSHFRIFCSPGIIEAEVSIYHRWGNRIAKFDGLTQAWDGTMNGVLCEQGTYVYRVVYRDEKIPNGKSTMAGTVTLLR